MKILIIFLGTIIGIIAFLFIIFLIILAKIKVSARKLGLNNINFKSIIDDIKNGMNDARYNQKHISGMTKLLKPSIERDFPTFNESELYNMAETGLRTIFNSLEDREVNNKLPLLKEQLKETIDDYKSSKVKVFYDDIVFHAFSLKKYYKTGGVATIEVQISLEYFYRKEKGNKVLENYSNYKKQTRYTVKFIYVYDITQVKDYTRVLGIHCPNCGAPVTSLGEKVCEYCHSGLDDLNLKNWMMSSYHEDY